MTPAELRAWLALHPRKGLGPAAVRRLLAACGSPQQVLDAGPTIWRELVSEEAVQALSRPPAELEAAVRRTEDWLSQSHAHVVTLGDPFYPAALLQTPDPPLMLFARGDLSLLLRPGLAVVGARHGTPDGCANAQAFAKFLGEAGLCVVSGLALGIDAAAHQGALATRGGTVAVLGTGPDVPYPRRNLALFDQIAAQGLLLSEQLPGAAPLALNFPRRNRIIAGLCLGTLVVEAALQSGSLITARLASEFGREVFAIPGSIHAPLAKGCHALIQQGAKLVQTGEDILQELRWQTALLPGTQATLPLDAPSAAADSTLPRPLDVARDTDPVLRALAQRPMDLDGLSAQTGMSAAALNARLLELELAGTVARLPGGCFQRIHQA